MMMLMIGNGSELLLETPVEEAFSGVGGRPF
jgi:hypothetical protein